eukprot:TRINITY_DN6064_c0_g1_i3.p1 TRINITY_DN6064_c0_g1~~TRINITY_DN6064_c0_g1_i3.p1  ORF type:complete len:631 (+),score=132.78 TRINITY_DN6064_c0_g1_i3:75-1895(+)
MTNIVMKDGVHKAFNAALAVGRWMYENPNLSSIAALIAAKVVKEIFSRLPDGVVLEISLDRMAFGEMYQDAMLKSVYGKKVCFVTMLELIESAAMERKVKAILIRTGSGGYYTGLAQVEELRSALTRYQKSTGNPVICYAPTFGEAGPGLLDYWLATSCSHIVMPTCGGLNITAPAAGPVFIKNLLGKLGLKADITQRSEYKNAGNMFTEDKMTEPHREQTMRLLVQCYDLLVEDLNATRKITKETVEAGPYVSTQALDLKLIDHIMYYDELVETFIPGLVGRKTVKLYSLGAFEPFAKQLYGTGWGKTKIALVTAEGGIHQGRSQGTLGGTPSIGSDTLCAQLREIRENKKVKGVLLRIDSRGGSYVASDLIHREMQMLKNSGIPIVVSMGNVAASGGYYIAMVGKEIFASRSTLTGSIGVVNGKVVCREMLGKIGVTVDPVKGGENSFYFSGVEEFEGRDKEVFEAQTDFMYADFKKNVGAARDMTPEQVEDLARGQVYFGGQAQDLSLTTHTGGYYEALRSLAALLSVPTEKLSIAPYPQPLTLATLLKKQTSREDGDRSPLQGLTLGAFALSVIPGSLSFLINTVQSTVEAELVAWGVPTFL